MSATSREWEPAHIDTDPTRPMTLPTRSSVDHDDAVGKCVVYPRQRFEQSVEVPAAQDHQEPRSFPDNDAAMKLRYLGLRHLQRKGKVSRARGPTDCGVEHPRQTVPGRISLCSSTIRNGAPDPALSSTAASPARCSDGLAPRPSHVRWSLAETAVKYRIEPYRQSKRATRGTLR